VFSSKRDLQEVQDQTTFPTVECDDTQKILSNCVIKRSYDAKNQSIDGIVVIEGIFAIGTVVHLTFMSVESTIYVVNETFVGAFLSISIHLNKDVKKVELIKSSDLTILNPAAVTVAFIEDCYSVITNGGLEREDNVAVVNLTTDNTCEVSLALIVAIVVAVVFALIIALFVGIYLQRKLKSLKYKKEQDEIRSELDKARSTMQTRPETNANDVNTMEIDL